MTTPEAQDAVFEAIVARMTNAVAAHDWLTARICVQMLHALAAQREAV